MAKEEKTAFIFENFSRKIYDKDRKRQTEQLLVLLIAAICL